MKSTGPVIEADVDVVPARAVAASRALIAEIDHGTATPAALDFSSSFTLVATRDSTIHAFLGYFDVAFARSQAEPGPSQAVLSLPVSDGDSSDAPVSARALWKQPESSMNGFTTGPHGTATHWKQTVFVLREPIQAKQGDEVRGQFTCRKSTTNPRELDLDISYYHAARDADGQAAEPKQLSYQLR
ncbi:hypothetical protein IWW57_002773 [Coemansia sp. S610]|nr:hypothetical protein IWW57_002773 [Coemansia sp. S610]